VAQAVEYLLCKCEGPDVKPQSHLKEKTKQNKKKHKHPTDRLLLLFAGFMAFAAPGPATAEQRCYVVFHPNDQDLKQMVSRPEDSAFLLEAQT
jgi:hypothetical protein